MVGVAKLRGGCCTCRARKIKVCQSIHRKMSSETSLATASGVLLVWVALLTALMFLCQCDGKIPCGPCSVKKRVCSLSLVLKSVIVQEKKHLG
jgi:hypothetical protein